MDHTGLSIFNFQVSNKNLFSGIALILVLFLSGCSSMPANGPSKSAIAELKDSTSSSIKYVEVTMVDALQLKSNATNKSTLVLDPAPASFDYPLVKGERLEIKIWEAASPGIYAKGDENYSLLEVDINAHGQIFLPFVGYIEVENLSLIQLQKLLVEKLEGLTVKPQVSVNRVSPEANSILVTGDVNAPIKLPYPPHGIRLLDAIALAQGSTNKAFDTEVYLIRNGKSNSLSLSDIIHQPSNNVLLAPKDNIVVKANTKTFTVFGSVNQQSRIKIDKESYFLSDAIAESGGLNDNKASVENVYLFRFEKQPIALSEEENSRFQKYGQPTIYHLNLNDPEAMFIANLMPINDRDMLYIAPAAASEFHRFLNLIISPITSGNRVITGK
tara:strand:+ start:2549 stop:3706 length:1158 start_codon:yes stop_codon:yes gene_type:complete